MSEPTQKLNKLLDKVDKVIAEQKKLEKKQEVILAAVATDEKTDVEIETQVTEEVKKMGKITEEITTANIFHSTITKVKKNDFLFPIVVIVGVVLVWRGLWSLFDHLPIINYSFVSIVLGVGILYTFNRIKSL